MELKRRITPKKSTIRKELESYVIAWNKPLKYGIDSMSYIDLLRNAHPAYRDSYARDLREVGHISKSEASEFIKMIGIN